MKTLLALAGSLNFWLLTTGAVMFAWGAFALDVRFRAALWARLVSVFTP